jgi:hypothetical protein
MLRSLFGAVVGLVLGGGAGCLTAILLYGSQPSSRSGWTSYPTLADAHAPGGVVLGQREIGPPEWRYWLFAGILYGGGFGLVGGAVVGGTAAVVAAMRRAVPPPSAPPGGASG